MNTQFSIFKILPSLEQAEELSQLLNSNGIQTRISNNIPPVDVTFSNSTVNHKYEVLIEDFNFILAESILEKNAEKYINEIDEDYHLNAFTNEELYDVLLTPDEWNEFDYVIAKKILTNRGESISDELLNSLKNQRLKKLAEPERNQKPWIIAGYIFAILGGFLGLIIGYVLWSSKKTLPNGTKVYSYSENDRKNGMYIFILGLIFFPISIIIRTLL